MRKKRNPNFFSSLRERFEAWMMGCSDSTVHIIIKNNDCVARRGEYK